MSGDRSPDTATLDGPEPWSPAEYGDVCASFYDQLYPRLAPHLLPCLVALAANGPVLELGIGTGRVALPLRKAGVAVHGIEASTAMIAEFRSRPGARSVPLVRGDFSCLPFRGPYRLVVSLVDTLALLPSERLQQHCLREISGLLGARGTFLFEGFDGPDRSGPVRHDHPISTAEGPRAYRFTSSPLPCETLDRLALAADLRLVARWGSWSREPYRPGSGHHVSLYRRSSGDLGEGKGGRDGRG